MLRFIWAERQPLATSPCPPPPPCGVFELIPAQFSSPLQSIPRNCRRSATNNPSVVKLDKHKHAAEFKLSRRSKKSAYQIPSSPSSTGTRGNGGPTQVPIFKTPRLSEVSRGGVLLVCAKVGTKTAVCFPCHFFPFHAAGAMRCLCRNFH